MWLVKRQSELTSRGGVVGMQRDPRAATINPVAGYNYKRSPQWSAETAVSEALYQNIYVYACARARAQDLSALPIRVGADPDKPKDFDPNHPLAKLLGPAPGGPTMNISARRLIAWTLIQYDITGRFGWEIAPPVTNRRDGVPFELWPLPTSKLTPESSNGGAEWFNGFCYEVQNGQKRHLSNSQVLYYWRPGQNDFREPESLLQAARLNVAIAVMQDRYDYAFILNDARPAAVVVHEAFDVKRERDAFRRQFLDSHRGPDNAGKTAFVETSRDGATPKDSLLIQSLGLSQRDAEFIERYENEIRAICVAFATPLSRLADSSRRTYANAERETLNYWRNAVKPAGVELAEAFNIGLMPMIGDSSNVCWFDTTGIPELEPPRRFAVGDIPELVRDGIITQNEGRHGIELPAVEGGDDFRVGDEADAPTPDPSSDDAPVGTPEPRSAPVVPRDYQHDAVLSNAAREFAPVLASTRAAVVEACRAALEKRASGKRGRQASRSDNPVALFDEAYWFNQCYSRFESVYRSIYVAVSMTMPPEAVAHPSTSQPGDAWVRTMCGAKATEFVAAVSEALANGADPSSIEAAGFPVSDVDYVVRSAVLCAVTGVVSGTSPAAPLNVVQTVEQPVVDTELATRVGALEQALAERAAAAQPKTTVRRIVRDSSGIPTAIVDEVVE